MYLLTGLYMNVFDGDVNLPGTMIFMGFKARTTSAELVLSGGTASGDLPGSSAGGTSIFLFISTSKM